MSPWGRAAVRWGASDVPIGTAERWRPRWSACQNAAMATFRARFFHDWGAGWLWAANDETRRSYGYDVDHHALGLSHVVVEEFDRLAAWHDSWLNRTDPDYPSLWRQPECDVFNSDVRSALGRLAIELGNSWELVEEFADVYEDPDLDRYLEDPGSFVR
jgi:hypothetical protein